MIFNPQKYSISDAPQVPFIDDSEIETFLNSYKNPSDVEVKNILKKSLAKNRLTLQETAILLHANSPEQLALIFDAAKELKNKIYGNRIVLFAPLYVGNKCSNNCLYCGFKNSNSSIVRKTLQTHELTNEIISLQNQGHKRLVLVFGEHAEYSPEFISQVIKHSYSITSKNGSIRRVNVNAAPLDEIGFKTIKDSGIGTYQVFQETYHKHTYQKYHTSGKKADYNFRLTAFDRAISAGVDDVGIGVLLGLYDWRYEVLALLRHVNHLEACFGIGPHTISFPRLQQAHGVSVENSYAVSDSDFAHLIAVLRLAVPYTGLILTARESLELRNTLLQFGISQIDGGTRIELGAYSQSNYSDQVIENEQFFIQDQRSLHDVIDELLSQKMLPSFCTACYRKNRTGQHFMEFSVPGFIKNFCTPNAILTLAEFACDYKSESEQTEIFAIINQSIETLDENMQHVVSQKIIDIKNGVRDIYF